MVGDWLKLHRKSEHSQVFQDDWLWRLWCWCLIRANYKPTKWTGAGQIGPGQFVTGRLVGSEALGVSASKFYRGLHRLAEMGMITVEANNKWTTVTIVNWRTYQSDYDDKRTTNEQPVNNQRTTNEQPADTVKERKKRRKKERKEYPPKPPRGKGEENGVVCKTPEEFVERWNRFVEGKPLQPCRKLSDKRRQHLVARLRDKDWQAAIQTAFAYLPLAMTDDQKWQPDIDWIIRNDTNLFRLAEGAFEWRSENSTVRKLREQRAQAEAEAREVRIAEDRKRRALEAKKTNDAIKSILHPKAGNDDEQSGSSLLFG